jgi:putative ABC transport system permease protein
MCVVARSLKHPVAIALSSFLLGAGAALVGVWALGTPWKGERVVEVEKVIEKVVEKPVEKPVPAPVDPPRVDLVVIQKGKPLGQDSNVSEYFVEVTRQLPGVERVSAAVVGTANTLRDNGAVDDTIILVQGWKPDNFGYETLSVLKGRKLQPGDSHKVMLGRILAENLNKKVGDKLTFVGDPDHPHEVIGIFKSTVVFEEGGAIVPFQDGQALHGLKGKVTGFTVRIKKLSPDSAAEVEAVKQKIEALRDPADPTVRLTAEPTERR